jgi:hypothetical protein
MAKPLRHVRPSATLTGNQIDWSQRLKILVSVVRFRPGPPRTSQQKTPTSMGWRFLFLTAENLACGPLSVQKLRRFFAHARMAQPRIVAGKFAVSLMAGGP